MPLTIQWRQEIPLSKATIPLPTCLSLLVTSVANALRGRGVYKWDLKCSDQAPALEPPRKHKHYLGTHTQSQKQTGTKNVSVSVIQYCTFYGALLRPATSAGHCSTLYFLPKYSYCLITCGVFSLKAIMDRLSRNLFTVMFLIFM